MSPDEADGYFSVRLIDDPKRITLWETLWNHYLRELLKEPSSLVELGAGRCEFINSADSVKRIAVDIWPGVTRYAAPGVEAHQADASKLDFIESNSVDAVFASNLIEHLTKNEAENLFIEAMRVLKPSGRLVLVQPNFRDSYRRYFDDFTHVTVWTESGIADFLASLGWKIVLVRRKFLPLTLKSRFPVSPGLIRMYLRSPWKPFAGQMLVVAVNPEV